MIRVSHGFDAINNWWCFNIDSSDAHTWHEAEVQTAVIREWCIERFGPPVEKERLTGWYVSYWRSFTIPDPAQAMEFKLRWVTPAD